MTHIDLASGHRFLTLSLQFLGLPWSLNLGECYYQRPIFPDACAFSLLYSRSYNYPSKIIIVALAPLLLWTFMQHQPKCWESFWLSQSHSLQHFTVEVTHTELPLATAFRGSKFNTLIYSILSGRLCGNEAPHHSVFKKKSHCQEKLWHTVIFWLLQHFHEIFNHPFLKHPDVFSANIILWPEKYDMENVFYLIIILIII